MENFLGRRADEALSERAVDPIIDSINPMVSTLLDFLHVPTSVRNSAVVKVLKKINDIPAIAGIPLHSIGTEHLEELFGLTMNHLMKANDPDTTLSQAIAEYLEPRNFALSTVNIYVAGGLIRGVSNAFTQNPNGKETISINRTALKNYFSNIFNRNPNIIVNNSLDANNYNEVIDNLPETKIDNLAQSIFDKEDKLSKERYDNKLLEIKDKLLEVNNNNETEANNLIKIYDAFFSQNALNYGVNRFDIANKMSIDFNLLEDNTGLNGNNSYNNNIIKANINSSNGTNANNINIDNNNPDNNAKNFNISGNNSNNNLTLEDYITDYNLNKNQQSTNIANYNPYVLDQNNNITIDTNTLKNTKTVFSNYSKKSKNSFTPMEWGYIQNSLKNNVFEDYYFDKNNRKLIIDLENVLITLSGENFNYLETAQKLPNYKAFEKWQEEHKDIVDNYNDQKKAKTINDIIAEAKELIGYRVTSYNQAINKNLDLTQEVNVLNIKDSKNTSKAEAKKLIWEIAETGEQIDTLSEPWVMDIINDRAKKYHLLNSSRYGKFSREDYFRRNVELNNIKDIINNSVLVKRVDNNKLDKKPNVEEYFYFYTPITDGNNIYLTKLFAEKLKGENDLKNIHLYDIMDVKTLDANLTNQNVSKDKSLLKGLSQASSLSIEQILKNVKDSNGNNAYDAYITENTNSLNQEEAITPTPETTTTDNNNNTNNTPFKEDNNPKGRINFLNGAKAIVELFRNKADQSTLLHETAHYFLKVTQTFAEEGNIIAEQQIEEVKNWTASELTKDPATMLHERFARGFELYVRSGKSNNSYLKEVFDYFRGFLERIHKSSEDLGIDVNNNQMYEFFDKYLYNPDRYSNWVYGDDDDKDNNTKDKQENVTNDTKDIGINAIENTIF